MVNLMKHIHVPWLIGLAVLALTASAAPAQRHSAPMPSNMAVRPSPRFVVIPSRTPNFVSPRQSAIITDPITARSFDRLEDRFERSFFFRRFDRFEDRFERRFGFDPLFRPRTSVLLFLP
jgi:hypothetical protein